ncbi:DUF418 domain-containing protein [Sphingomonas sp.]|uniref:DUF418 domain-containing protein n=1 Tax=Sphingomonas sp. TaxID=28214 RepID=UPI003B3B0CD2
MNKDRILALDVIRGFAVCGILIMNIVSMGMPTYAYVDPRFYGGAHGADLAAWASAYILADGKMRALFTMLFGASLLLITDAAEDRTPGPARIHYARIFWLFVFGMLHAWFVWYGDILVEYAICGAIAFIGRTWTASALAFTAICLIGYDGVQSLIQWHDVNLLQTLATGPNPPLDAVREWNKVLAQVVPNPAAIAHEIQLYRGSFADVFAARAPTTGLFQFQIVPATLPGTLGFVFLGMLLYRLGFWTGQWSHRAYRQIVVAGVAALLLYIPLTGSIIAHDFDPAFLPLADVLTLMLRPFVALGYAALLILALRAGAARELMDRLGAAGRMAFSNYLLTSLVMTTIFYGYGLGWFGSLSRAQLYWLVAGQWALMLLWSRPWLRRFHYGPFEWAWRSLSRGQLVPFRRAIAS